MRFTKAVQSVTGRRLTYKNLIGKGPLSLAPLPA
jgi:hypothetical protein